MIELINEKKDNLSHGKKEKDQRLGGLAGRQSFCIVALCELTADYISLFPYALVILLNFAFKVRQPFRPNLWCRCANTVPFISIIASKNI